MKEGAGIIIFFTMPALLIEVIVFVLGAIVFQPIDHAEEACVHIVNWSNSYTPIMLISFAVSIVMLGISAMFATEYWKPLGNIFISIFGE